MTGCDQCQVVSVNGTATHEYNCPNHWIDPATGRGYPKPCWECGFDYVPTSRDEARNRHRICPDCIASELEEIEA